MSETLLIRKVESYATITTIDISSLDRKAVHGLDFTYAYQLAHAGAPRNGEPMARFNVDLL